MKTTLLAGALCLALASPLAAQEASSCYSFTQVVHDLEAQGGEVVGVANYHGAVTDELIIVQSETVITVVGFKNGCYVGYQVLEPAVPQKDA